MAGSFESTRRGSMTPEKPLLPPLAMLNDDGPEDVAADGGSAPASPELLLLRRWAVAVVSVMVAVCRRSLSSLV